MTTRFRDAPSYLDPFGHSLTTGIALAVHGGRYTPRAIDAHPLVQAFGDGCERRDRVFSTFESFWTCTTIEEHVGIIFGMNVQHRHGLGWGAIGVAVLHEVLRVVSNLTSTHA